MAFSILEVFKNFLITFSDIKQWLRIDHQKFIFVKVVYNSKKKIMG